MFTENFVFLRKYIQAPLKKKKKKMQFCDLKTPLLDSKRSLNSSKTNREWVSCVCNHSLAVAGSRVVTEGHIWLNESLAGLKHLKTYTITV